MKLRAIAIGSVIVVGLGIVTITYNASAAENGCQFNAQFLSPCPTDSAKQLCKAAKVINGVAQEPTEFAQTFPADRCDFTVTEVLGASDANPIFGAPFSPSAELANCPPNTTNNPSVTVTLQQGSKKISGDLVEEGDEFSADLLGLVGAEWGKRTSKSTLVSEVRTVTTERTVTVPKGKRGRFEFHPRRAQIKGFFTIASDDQGGGGPFGPEPRPWETTVATTIDAPLMLAGGNPDGEVRPLLTDCTGDEGRGDDPEPFPSEPPR
jgi:hypothetical protein